MQNMKTIALNGSNPAILSEDEDQRERRLKEALKYKTEYDEFIEEEKALAADPNATRTFNGKMIRRHPMRRQELTDRLITNPQLVEDLIGLGITAKMIETLIHDIPNALRAVFVQKADERKIMMDDKYIYDTEGTSFKVWEKLDNERKHVTGMEEALQEWVQAELREGRPIDPMNAVYFSPYLTQVQEIAECANKCNMRPHPETGEFVHNIDRVRGEEEKLTLDVDGNDPQYANYLVRVFRPKSSLSIGDSRRQRLKYEELYATDDVDGIAGNEPEERPAPAIPPPPGISLSLK